MNPWFTSLKHRLLPKPKTLKHLRQHLCCAQQERIIDQETFSMLEGVLNISKLNVSDVMIPRSQMVFVEQHQTPDQFLPIIVNSAHSRFPVCGEHTDDVVGILLAKELLKHFILSPEKKLTLKTIPLRPPMFVPESKPLDALLHDFRSSHTHMAIVVDEYSNIAGMVTIEDVLEEIVGDIEDEFDATATKHITQITKTTYRLHAHTPIEEFNQQFGTNFPNEKADSIGGLIILHLQRLPHLNEKIHIEHLTFTATKVDKRRILQLKLSLPKGH